MNFLFDDLDSRVIRAARGPAVYYTLLIFLYFIYYFILLYTTFYFTYFLHNDNNVVCIPYAVQIYGILITCFDPNESSADLNTCTWPYKSTMYLQCGTVQFKTIYVHWSINYNSEIK
jgi:hypothetical protein